MAEADPVASPATGALAPGRILGSRLVSLWRLGLSHGASLLNLGGVLLIAAVFGAHLWATWTNPYVNNFSNPEEWAYTNITSGNYLRFGFGNSLLLQDVSSSPDPADHPYVYNHMPPGPDIATALVRKATGDDFRLTRLFFALLACPASTSWFASCSSCSHQSADFRG